MAHGQRIALFGIVMAAGLFGTSVLAGNAGGTCGDDRFIQAVNKHDATVQQFVEVPALYAERWDTLKQPRFWRQVMQLGEDYTILNNASTREIYEILCTDEWEARSDKEQEAKRKALREWHCLDDDARIYATTGKADFYQFRKALPAISRGTQLFCEQGVDPWYAQSILLIESPGRSQRSPVGALGSFQLMRSVAIRFGLKVNRYRDERKDFDKSAVAASRLLNEVCIPETKKMLDKRNICYDEDDLWFRLLVLHVYHAGAYNVGGAINKIRPTTGDMSLITTLWQTEHGRFRNASQNYSQVALASLLELNELIYQDCAFLVQEALPITTVSLF